MVCHISNSTHALYFVWFFKNHTISLKNATLQIDFLILPKHWHATQFWKRQVKCGRLLQKSARSDDATMVCEAENADLQQKCEIRPCNHKKSVIVIFGRKWKIRERIRHGNAASFRTSHKTWFQVPCGVNDDFCKFASFARQIDKMSSICAILIVWLLPLAVWTAVSTIFQRNHDNNFSDSSFECSFQWPSPVVWSVVCVPVLYVPVFVIVVVSGRIAVRVHHHAGFRRKHTNVSNNNSLLVLQTGDTPALMRKSGAVGVPFGGRQETAKTGKRKEINLKMTIFGP